MTSAPSSSDVAARYRRLASKFTNVIESLSPEMWTAATPCEGWTVRDVVAHVVETERDFLQRMPFAEALNLSTDRPDQLVSSWSEIRDAMQRSLDNTEHARHRYDGYFGPTTFEETADVFYSGDLVVHAWDIAKGAGLTNLEIIDPAEMRRTRTALEAFGDVIRSPGIYGPVVEVADDATEQERFLAWTGRRAN